ncbi:meiotic nuclear division protein 1 homolog isoform X2 [Daktulosphaira vitifoliae]|uniref:meiotic nuclear division protein 1 homolog isoform X2 n=1 Tax=Daktulosphaira vitifoliae TaxID=58002 RepID=UPI0021A9B73D|nr:meiotic nuclear division protein 1 homolog isoform X2 [Daktulosphaira vitifoliae]
MSKRKTVSADEKRERMLQIFHEKKDFFQLKDLEKIAPKEKQIVVQSVKDVVQALVDDGLVDTDKIGSSIYFWAFPSKAKAAKIANLNNAKAKLEEYKRKLDENLDFLKRERIGKEDSNERTDLLKKLKVLQDEKSKLDMEVNKYKDLNADDFEKMLKNIDIAKEAGNRWTDNIYSVKSWCRKKFFIEDSMMNKQFGISEDLDYID